MKIVGNETTREKLESEGWRLRSDFVGGLLIFEKDGEGLIFDPGDRIRKHWSTTDKKMLGRKSREELEALGWKEEYTIDIVKHIFGTPLVIFKKGKRKLTWAQKLEIVLWEGEREIPK
jgi:hypothetical protein